MVATNHCFLGHIIEWLYALFIIGKGVTGMDARNRMADVVKLRCNACQDFLKLIISDNWQQFVYNKAQREIQDNGRYKEKYLSAYEKMREIGIDNYSVDDMDLTGTVLEVTHQDSEDEENKNLVTAAKISFPDELKDKVLPGADVTVQITIDR